MDAEDLRKTYDQYFLVDKNKWSSTDKKKTLKVARRTFEWLYQLGFKKKNPKLLDVGCATGFYTQAFALIGAEAVGLDYSEVAIKKATSQFPSCRFVQMNGFDPAFDETFDIIFCRGFSGANTHDMNFIATWVNKYMRLLNEGGYFIFAYSSNFSGKEDKGQIVNHSRLELKSLVSQIQGQYRGTFIFYYFGFLSRIKRMTERLIRKDARDYFYIFIQK